MCGGLQAAPGNAPKSTPAPSQNTQPAIMKPTEEPPAYSQQRTQVWRAETCLYDLTYFLYKTVMLQVHAPAWRHALLFPLFFLCSPVV